MVAQPTLSCHNTTSRVFWEWYASFMVLIYPVGVPVLFFVLLHLQREKIKRVMLVQKALEDGKAPEYSDTMSEEEQEHTKALFTILSATGEDLDDITIHTIAHADSVRRRSQEDSNLGCRSAFQIRTSEPTVRGLVRQFNSSRTLQDDEGMRISPLLLSMQHYFEKYEGPMYW